MTDPTQITAIDDRTIGLLQIGAQALDDITGCGCALCALADRDGLALHHAIVSRWNLGGWAPSQQEADTLTGVYALTLALRRACIAAESLVWPTPAESSEDPQPQAEAVRAEDEHHDSSMGDIAAWWVGYRRETDASALHVPAVRGSATAAGLDPDAVEEWLRSRGWREQSYGRGVPRRWVQAE